MSRPRYPWIKLWLDCLSDPKLKRLSMAERCCFYELLLLCGMSPIRGKLMLTDTEPMDLDDLKRTLGSTRNDKQTISKVIPKLINMKVISIVEGAYQLNNFISRQEKYPYEYSPNKLRINSELTPNKLLKKKKEIQKQNIKEIYKEKYGEFKNVLLSSEELEKLTAKYTDIQQRIEKLSVYKTSTGKDYKSDYATILNWALKDPPIKEIKDDEW